MRCVLVGVVVLLLGVEQKGSAEEQQGMPKTGAVVHELTTQSFKRLEEIKARYFVKLDPASCATPCTGDVQKFWDHAAQHFPDHKFWCVACHCVTPEPLRDVIASSAATGEQVRWWHQPVVA